MRGRYQRRTLEEKISAAERHEAVRKRWDESHPGRHKLGSFMLSLRTVLLKRHGFYDTMPKSASDSGVINGIPWKLVPSRGGYAKHRLFAQCPGCHQWVPAGRLTQHYGTKACYEAKMKGVRTRRDPSSLSKADKEYWWKRGIRDGERERGPIFRSTRAGGIVYDGGGDWPSSNAPEALCGKSYLLGYTIGISRLYETQASKPARRKRPTKKWGYR